MTTITFDSNDLQTASILTESIEHSSIPTKDVKLYALAHANKSVIPHVSYPSKRIRISGTLIAASIVAMDALEDTFKSYFRGTDKNLDIGHNSGTRRYIATVNGMSIDRPGGLQYAKFNIEFVCTDPFGRNTSTSSALSADNRTLASYDDDDYVFLGTAPFQLPVITILYDAISGGTAKTVSYGNGDTGQTISITRTWVAGETLVIDTFNRTVMVDSVEVDFTGAFPIFEPGASSLIYTDDFTTSRTFDIDVDYYPRYL